MCCVLLLIPTSECNSGGVQITLPSHPLYIHVGSSLRLSCSTTTNTTKLFWKKQWNNGTKGFSHLDLEERGWEIKFISKTSLERLESLLTIHRVRMSDYGLYVCYDQTTDFEAWLNVVKMNHVDHVIVPPPTPPSNTSSVSLHCKLQGVDKDTRDPSTIIYSWLHKGEMVSTSSSRDRTIGNRFTLLSSHKGDSTLNISPAQFGDAGRYTCLFTLSTTKGTLNFTQIVTLDTSNLDTTTVNGVKPLTVCTVLLFTSYYVFLSCCKQVVWSRV